MASGDAAGASTPAQSTDSSARPSTEVAPSTASTSTSAPAPDTVLSPPLAGMRLSEDLPRASTEIARAADEAAAAVVNGDGAQAKAGEESRTGQLERELEITRGEKERLESQYRSLLSKLTAMRNTLGERLKQDAEELDRREAQITTLTSQTTTLQSTISTLQTELASSESHNSTLLHELSSLRSRFSTSERATADEALLLQGQLREREEEAERERVGREEWERVAHEEGAAREEWEQQARELAGELEMCRVELERERDERRRAEEASRNLEAVLSEFQASKDAELAQAVSDSKATISSLTQSLAEYKSRALNAEVKLGDMETDATRVQQLEKEVKEKTVLIGKVRHEAVILNEHLTEALRRLRKQTAADNVDRRLITNILISFLTTPRADPKRFEMLSLLASVLSWDDEEREQAGLQRGGGAGPSAPGRGVRRVSSASPAAAGAGGQEEESAASESFGTLFVEFLLKETQSSANLNQPPSASSSPPLPSGTSTPASPLSPGAHGHRRATPNAHFRSPNIAELTLPPTPPEPRWKSGAGGGGGP